MEHQYLAFTVRSVIKVILLASFIVNCIAQQNNSITATPSITTDDSTNNGTTVLNNATSANIPTSQKPPSATTTTTTTTTAKPLGNLRPVGESCLKLYFNCTEKSPEFLKANFCQAFRENVACINNTSKGCSIDEANRIDYVDCGPNVLGTSNTVGTLCQGRITECLSLSDKPENIKITTDFKTFFCSKQTKPCLIEKHDNKTVCTDAEYTAALTIAKCTAAHTVISSALFITLAALTQRIIYRY